jgi:predicted MFS family arabinose efflux permease
MISRMFSDYGKLQRPIVMLIIAEFFLQLINTSFTLILNIYLMKQGYKDSQVADFVSYRYIGVLLFALPLGLIIKGRKLKPFFYFAGLSIPVCSMIILYATEFHIDNLLHASLFFWGISFTCIQITVLPYILRNASEETFSEAISLNYATWSVGTIVSGLLIYVLSGIPFFSGDEKIMLELFSFAGLISIVFIFLMKDRETIPGLETKRRDLRAFDWTIILKALAPTLIIAVGAGLTIPFINLFFYNVFHMDSGHFSMMGSVSAVLVAIGALFIPQIKKRYGYGVAIIFTQSMAVVALILLAATEFFSNYTPAFYVAVACYLFRQPLMNMAGPITSELIMDYVGKRNHEMLSALSSAIWSGSWYISSRIFKTLREEGFSYSGVFFITALLYVVGVIWYQMLIRDYQKKPGTSSLQ